jgi:hypothetical protein
MSRYPALMVALFLSWCCAVGSASAGSTTRYALVVGNNYGNTTALELDNLQHAEREAGRLRDQLIRFGNFDPERVILVTGKGRTEILAAASRLARLHRQDREQLGELPSLFAFFFTGHGLSGQLLTADQSLQGQDLADIFGQMDATLTLGFFDACYAGSLDLVELKAKGVVSTPGFNPVAELPDELLNSEGTMWFASSRPNELSYEDEGLGGLFTHFFVEAFTHAPQGGVGITLDNMWEYARSRTLAHAAKYGRNQTPEKIVRNLKARGPLYFSYPRERSATLVFEEQVAGTFLLRYDYGALVEKVVKAKGRPKEVAVYEGKLTLSRVDPDAAGSHPSRHLKLGRGEEVRIRSQGTAAGMHGPGYDESPIHSKGHLPGLELTQRAASPALVAGASYRFSLVPQRVLGVPHSFAGGAWFAHGPLCAAVEVSYGVDSGSYQTWSYDLAEVGLHLRAGYGFDLGGPRLDLLAIFGMSFFDLTYKSGAARQPLGGWLGGGVRFLLPLPLRNPWVILAAQAGIGARISEGIAKDDRETYWSPEPVFTVGLSVPIL